jgi:outer membrane protein assembly factor BamB
VEATGRILDPFVSFEIMRCDIVVRRHYCSKAQALIGLLLVLAFAGCGDRNERSASAMALPSVSHDPLEETQTTQNWPAWRGVNTSGVSSDQSLPVEWTTEKGIRWKQSVPGRGNSSPVVWGDQVLITSALGEAEGSRLVVCSFDRRTGKLQWQADAGQARGSSHNKNGYASASVVTDGQQVFASFGGAGLFAWELATGRPQWHADLGALQHEWGSASSPVLVGNYVIQLCDSEAESSLKAFDKRDGSPVWSTSRTSTGCWSTPVLVDANDAGGQKLEELVVNGTGVDGAGSGCIIAYDPGDGHELWKVQGTTGVVCPTAIVGGGLVISTSGRNGPIIAIQPGGAGDVTTSNVVWKHARGGAYVPTGVAYRNRLYALADGGVISCFNLGSGEEIWRERLRGTFTASLVAGDGRIYAVNEYGMVYVMAASDNYQSLATNDMQERTLATPAIAAGDLFLRTESQLYCVAGQSDNRSASAGVAQK